MNCRCSPKPGCEILVVIREVNIPIQESHKFSMSFSINDRRTRIFSHHCGFGRNCNHYLSTLLWRVTKPVSQSTAQMEPCTDSAISSDPELSPNEYEILVQLDQYVNDGSLDDAFTVIREYLDGEPRWACLDQFLDIWDRGSPDESFLSRLFGESGALAKCSRRAFEILLSCDPDTILEGDDPPLRKAIRDSRFHEKARIMIDFMHQEGLKLDEEGDALQLPRGGRQCLAAAFDKPAKNKPGLDKDYIIKLVKLGSAKMLNTPDEVGMLPLHRLVEFDNCHRDPSGQLELIKFLLDRCEESVLKPVPLGAKYTSFTNGTAQHKRTPKELYVYQWHLYTKSEYGSRNAPMVNNQRQLRKRAPYPLKGSLSRNAAGGQKGKDGANNKGSENAGRLQNTKEGDIKPAGGVGHSKKTSSGAPDISLGIGGKIGKSEAGLASVRTLTPLGEDARDEAKIDMEDEQRLALQASAKILDELGRRFLRLTVGKDKDETDAREFFEGNGIGTQSESRCEVTYCLFRVC